MEQAWSLKTGTTIVKNGIDLVLPNELKSRRFVKHVLYLNIRMVKEEEVAEVRGRKVIILNLRLTLPSWKRR